MKYRPFANLARRIRKAKKKRKLDRGGFPPGPALGAAHRRPLSAQPEAFAS